LESSRSQSADGARQNLIQTFFQPIAHPLRCEDSRPYARVFNSFCTWSSIPSSAVVRGNAWASATTLTNTRAMAETGCRRSHLQRRLSHYASGFRATSRLKWSCSLGATTNRSRLRFNATGYSAQTPLNKSSRINLQHLIPASSKTTHVPVFDRAIGKQSDGFACRV
jgi:hypothetical protein